ncbi:MAG: SGNH/GDSL hydrolase family protein [Phycisphaeraceae bacterium]|nr:SGNH/GDSL hydrolase family protein [Phycisphaeraceae bacterium]
MITAHDVVLFQGDSITDCGRAKDDQPWMEVDQLGRGYVMLSTCQILHRMAGQNVKVINKGISGNRVTDLWDRWQSDCIDLRPNLVSILVGVNDTWHGIQHGKDRGVPVDVYERVYRQILEKTVQELPGVKLVLGEPFTFRCGKVTDAWEPEMSQRLAIVRQLAKDFGARLVPFQVEVDKALRVMGGDYWAHDGVHPKLAGHSLLANVWLNTVLGW